MRLGCNQAAGPVPAAVDLDVVFVGEVYPNRERRTAVGIAGEHEK